jgi:hypothetical protein
MILRYHGLPNLNPAGNYQCGIVGGYYFLLGGALHPCAGNCFLCVTPASSLFEIQRIIDGYGNLAQQAGIPSRILTSRARFGQLPLTDLARELDAGRPVLAGVSFPGQPTLPGISGHAVVISGYSARTPIPTVTIRDPYPYELYIPANQNPYLLSGATYLGPGSYRVQLPTLSTSILWGNTLYEIR